MSMRQWLVTCGLVAAFATSPVIAGGAENARADALIKEFLAPSGMLVATSPKIEGGIQGSRAGTTDRQIEAKAVGKPEVKVDGKSERKPDAEVLFPHIYQAPLFGSLFADVERVDGG